MRTKRLGYQDEYKGIPASGTVRLPSTTSPTATQWPRPAERCSIDVGLQRAGLGRGIKSAACGWGGPWGGLDAVCRALVRRAHRAWRVHNYISAYTCLGACRISLPSGICTHSHNCDIVSSRVEGVGGRGGKGGKGVLESGICTHSHECDRRLTMSLHVQLLPVALFLRVTHTVPCYE